MNYDATLAALTDEQLTQECIRTYTACLALRAEERRNLVKTSWDRCMMECQQRPEGMTRIWSRAVDWMRKERGLTGVE